MRAATLAFLLWVMALAVSAPAAETLFGPSDVAAIIGNGGLTVGINDYGRVSLCRWPSPSYSDQITYVTRDASLPALGIAPEHGCMWAIRLEDRTLWLTGAPWTRVPGGEHPEDPVLEIRTTTPGGEITAVQRVAVLPGADLLALHLSISGPATPPTVFWYQNITPCTRIIPEWPVADWAFDAANDFAAFVDDERIVHFRPESPTFVEWEEAERLNGRDSTPREWLAFDKGVYAVTASPQGFDTATCSQTGGGDAWHQVDAGALIGTRAAWGQCQSAAAVKTTESDGVFEATILIAFGPDYARATETLERYLDRPFEQLASETRQYWQDWLETMRLPASPDPHNRSLAQRALLTIGMCRDKTSGAIVRSPETQPPLCLDWPRNGVWISEAFTAAGRDDLARTLTSFHAKTQRLSGSEVRAYGSLPAACYANGVEGVPHVIRDLDATAWFLWETARRALGEERDVRESFWRELHPAITRAADFLIYWTDERTSKPLHAFSPGLMRDAQTLEQLVTTFLGINAAVAVAEGTGLPVPEEWRVRQGELRTLVEFACFNEEGDVRLDVPRAFMFAEVVRPGAPRMLPVFEALLKPGAQKDFPEGVATLLNGAYAAPGLATRPVLREAVEGFLAGMGQENGRIPKPLRVDALTSAEFYLLLMRTYGGEE